MESERASYDACHVPLLMAVGIAGVGGLALPGGAPSFLEPAFALQGLDLFGGEVHVLHGETGAEFGSAYLGVLRLFAEQGGCLLEDANLKLLRGDLGRGALDGGTQGTFCLRVS